MTQPSDPRELPLLVEHEDRAFFVECAAFVAAKWAAEPSDSAHDMAHLNRVHNTAFALARADQALWHETDPDLLSAACAFHDAVNLPKDHPDRAAGSWHSAQWAVAQPPVANWDAARMDALAHAIETHSFSSGKPPLTAEARVLRDADRLDALGPVGIARLFAVSGALGRPLYDPEDPFARHRPLDDSRFAIDHVAVKLMHLREGMCTDFGRVEAERRTRALVAFMARFAAQIGHGDAFGGAFSLNDTPAAPPKGETR